MKIEITVSVYETKDGEKPADVKVESHWNWDDFAQVTIDGKTATVNRTEMIAALQRTGCKP